MPTSQDYIASITENLQWTDDYLDKIMKREEIANEGVISSLWDTLKIVFKKIISAVVSLWKHLVAFVKTIFKKITNMFRSSAKEDILPHPVSINIISMESAQIDNRSFNSKNEIKKSLQEATDSISREIKYRTKLQIDTIEKIRDIVEENKEELITESKQIYHAHVNVTDDKSYSYVGNDAFSAEYSTDIRNFNKAKIEHVLSSSDIVSQYNSCIRDYINNIIYSESFGANDSIFGVIKETCDYLQNKGMTKEQINDFIVSEYFNVPKDSDSIRRLLQLKLNYNKHIISLLEDMVRINYRQAGFTEKEIEDIVSGIRQNSYDEITDAYAFIKANEKEIRVYDGFLDFRKFNGGVVFYHPYDSLMEHNVNDLIGLYNLSLKYDCIIHTHGGSINTQSSLRLSAEKQQDLVRISNRKKRLEYKFGEKYSQDELDEDYFYDQLSQEYAEKYKKQLNDIDHEIKEIKSRGVKVKSPRTGRLMTKYNNPEDSIRLRELEDKRFRMKEVIRLKTGYIQEDDDEFNDELQRRIDSQYQNEKVIKYQRIQSKLDEQIADIQKHKRYDDESHEQVFNGDNYELVVQGRKIKEKIAELEQKGAPRSEIDKLYDEVSIIRNKVREEQYDRKLKYRYIVWTCLPVKIGDHPLTDDVNQALRYAIKDGYKRIMCLICNGGNVGLADDVKRARGVTITMATDSLASLGMSYGKKIKPKQLPTKESFWFVSDIRNKVVLECYKKDFTNILIEYFESKYNVDPRYVTRKWIEDHYFDPIIIYECPYQFVIDNHDGTFGFESLSSIEFISIVGNLYEKTIS